MKYLTAFFSLLYLGTLIAAEWPLAEIKIRTADPANPIQKLAGRELEKHLHLIAGRMIPLRIGKGSSNARRRIMLSAVAGFISGETIMRQVMPTSLSVIPRAVSVP